MQQLNCSNNVLPENIAISAALGLCFVFGVPGNIAALWILIRRLENDSMTTRLMLSLAVSDLLSKVPLPFWIWGLLHGWPFGPVVCKLLVYILYCCIYSSLICVTFLSVQRYMQVLHQQRWATLGADARRGLLCGIWMVSGALTVYAPVQRNVICIDGLQFCNPHYNNDTERVAIASMETLLFMLFLFLLVYFYYHLHRGVNETPFFSSNRLTNLVTRIVVTFFILSVGLPITNILTIAAVVLKSESLHKTADLGNSVAKALMTINSCVNPFLYTFSLRDRQHNSDVTQNT